MKVDFDLLKSNISLPDFLRDQLGWKQAQGSTYKNPKMTSPSEDQTIVIKKNHKGHYTYWDIHNDKIKGSSIIDLMQNHLYNMTGKQVTFREAGEILQTYVDSGKTILPEQSKYHVNNELLDADYILNVLKNCKPVYDTSFFVSRGIDKDILKEKEWKDTFIQRQHVTNNNGYVQSFVNTCVKLVNIQGVQGISQRNEGFKGALGNRYDTISSSRIDRTKPIDKLHLGESMIDHISYYQMNYYPNNDKNILFVSSEGAITEGQIRTIQTILEKNDIKSIELNFDNDLAGLIYSIKIAGGLSFNEKNNSIENFNITKGKDTDENRIYIDFKLNTNSVNEVQSIIDSIFDKKLLEEFFDQESISMDRIYSNDKSSSFLYSFPPSKEVLKDISKKLILYKFGKEVQLVLPQTKDFNDDLKLSIESKKQIQCLNR